MKLTSKQKAELLQLTECRRRIALNNIVWAWRKIGKLSNINDIFDAYAEVELKHNGECREVLQPK